MSDASLGGEGSVDNTQRRQFGQVSKLRSGRWQARWKLNGTWYTARQTDDDNHDLGPLTFSTRRKAEDHLGWVRREIEVGRWRPPVKAPKKDVAPSTLRAYADDWLARRPLKPTTREKYRALLDRTIFPALGDRALTDVDAEAVDGWYHGLDASKATWRAHAYQLLHAILTTAKERRLIAEVPSIKGAGRAKRKRPLRPLSRDELAALTAAMPERSRVLTLMMAWCALRYGEATALRRRHVDLARGIVHVDRGVTRTKGEWHEDTPKAGESADVAIPPHIVDAVKRHVDGLGPDELLFPARRGGYLIAATYNKAFTTAKQAIGRPDVRPHDLRHTGLFMAAEAGASPQELMQRGRHRTAQASQIYWHAARERDAEIAKRMSEQVGNVVPITTAQSKQRKETATK